MNHLFHFNQDLSWRKDYRMDEILDEDFSDMEEDFPAEMNAFDYTGRPGMFEYYLFIDDLHSLYA
jgi:hypothetical protein